LKLHQLRIYTSQRLKLGKEVKLTIGVIKKVLATVLVCFSTSTLADNRAWTGEEKAWLGTAAAATVSDWATTRDLSRRYREGYYENNPILGKHPSTSRVDLYFVSAGLLGYVIADNLDQNRKLFLQGWTAVEILYTNRNLNLGLKIKF
jgi:hypothetical protein